jgi:hypothetical protein
MQKEQENEVCRKMYRKTQPPTQPLRYAKNEVCRKRNAEKWSMPKTK